MRRAIYWYIRASGGATGFDGGIVLLQAALELLAWQYFVLDEHVPASNDFLKKPASDRIRLLLKACGIPIDIPTELKELVNVAASCAWNDGPKVDDDVLVIGWNPDACVLPFVVPERSTWGDDSP